MELKFQKDNRIGNGNEIGKRNGNCHRIKLQMYHFKTKAYRSSLQVFSASFFRRCINSEQKIRVGRKRKNKT